MAFTSLGLTRVALRKTLVASGIRSRSRYMTPRRIRLSNLVESLATAFSRMARESWEALVARLLAGSAAWDRAAIERQKSAAEQARTRFTVGVPPRRRGLRA